MAPTPAAAAEALKEKLEALKEQLTDERNRPYVIGGAVALVATAGLVYYLRSSSGAAAAAKPAGETGTPKPKKKKSKAQEKRADEDRDAASDVATPPPEAASVGDASPSKLPFDAASLTPEERAQRSKDAKNRGNQLYQQRRFAEAIDAYTEAIAANPEEAIYYSNRAACYTNLGRLDECIADCNEALKLNPMYLKALGRRAVAFEKKQDWYNALVDYTAMCIIEEFKVDATVQSTDRILKEVAKQKSEEIMKARTTDKQLPSSVFISAYLDSFRKSYSEAGLEGAAEGTGDAMLRQSIRSILAKNYQQSFDEVKKAIDLGVSPEHKSTAYNLLGTFNFLLGEVDQAITDFETSLAADPNNVNSIIKFAGCQMEKGDVQRALEEFERASELDAGDADVYYHRGQIKFLLGDYPSALEDYERALEIDPEFVFNHIQIAVIHYRMNDVQTAVAKFEETLRKYPHSADVRNYYGEIMLDQSKFDEAQQNFDKAIRIRPISPLAYMNKAFLHLNQGDLVKAERACVKATEVDAKCDLAYSQWAQILMQQNRVDEAMEKFDKAIALSRTEPELMQIVMFRTAASAQQEVLRKWPTLALKLMAATGR